MSLDITLQSYSIFDSLAERSFSFSGLRYVHGGGEYEVATLLPVYGSYLVPVPGSGSFGHGCGIRIVTVTDFC
jgi:hypothetical protein